MNYNGYMSNLRTSQEKLLASKGMLDLGTGQLNSYGELIASERHYGIGGVSDDGDYRFSEMGPDLIPGTNVVGP